MKKPNAKRELKVMGCKVSLTPSEFEELRKAAEREDLAPSTLARRFVLKCLRNAAHSAAA